ncbi:MAG: DJ-1/PfpI family protein [Acidobacteria bacterium]|nr:DJ-1/PfpI family protein [Acidobacteriota bacterium]
MEIAILLYEQMTALDAIGPYEVLRSMPNAKVRFVAREKGIKHTDAGYALLNAEYALDEVTKPDIVLVPGTAYTQAMMKDAVAHEWLRQVHETSKWTTSVCTGSLILGAAGLLQGLKATTHWLAMDTLRMLGAEAVQERFVKDGKVITAAGVSAGIDMALTLVALECGETVAQAIQLMIEYDPQPPFNAGSPDKAPTAIVEMLRATQKIT